MYNHIQVKWLRQIQWAFLIVLALISLFIGVTEVALLGVLKLDPEQIRILLISRVPRLISIVITGSSLAIAGIIMQSITRNRFVSPTTAGTMEWCRLGVMMAILVFPDIPPFLRVAAAFLVSLFGTALFLAIVERIQSRNIIFVPLAGMMLGGVVNAITLFFAYGNDVMQNMASWLQGNFSLVIKDSYELLHISVPFMILCYLYADRFTIVGMGKTMSTGLGLNHAGVVRVGLLIVAVISSVTIVGVGNIPFLGLVVPNLVRIYQGDSLKNTLFDTAWLGAVLVLVCDILGRLIIYPYEIPIGIIFSVVGGGLFLYLLFRRKSLAS
ncbi:iron chelate uptake ABC transporter family permease subunit [Microvirga sp. W0021]|uniref:Iron chelate uptake ABC transporter family permease subunit n=1 Tax=Hohaiivirga grylli TaxID=3133970 RepID=A0ABV0BJV2_9HYPH